jgi:iron complex transport system ATP-binding protein
VTSVLELDNATVVKGGQRVLDGLTLSIGPGQHTAIMGPNGAGKSALLQLLTLQDRPLARDEGRPPVRVFGEDRWNVFDLRPRLGIVSADLHERLVIGNSRGRIRVSDAVLSGYFGMHGLTPADTRVPAAMHDGVRVALERMEAAHLIDRCLDELSTGEARRVVVARALVTVPSALVLDEPANGLDLVARHHLVQLINRVAEAGTTVILITHQVEELLPAISNIILLKQGRVLAQGSRETMLTSAQLSRLYDTQIELTARGGHLTAVVTGRPERAGSGTTVG